MIYLPIDIQFVSNDFKNLLYQKAVTTRNEVRLAPYKASLVKI